MDIEFNEDDLANITAGQTGTGHSGYGSRDFEAEAKRIENQKAIIAGMTQEKALEKYKNNEITTNQLASIIGEEHEIVKAAREFEALESKETLMIDINNSGMKKN